MCKFMGDINIPVRTNGKELEILVFEDVVIDSNIDRWLFSVNSL